MENKENIDVYVIKLIRVNRNLTIREMGEILKVKPFIINDIELGNMIINEELNQNLRSSFTLTEEEIGYLDSSYQYHIANNDYEKEKALKKLKSDKAPYIICKR